MPPHGGHGGHGGGHHGGGHHHHHGGGGGWGYGFQPTVGPWWGDGWGPSWDPTWNTDLVVVDETRCWDGSGFYASDPRCPPMKLGAKPMGDVTIGGITVPTYVLALGAAAVGWWLWKKRKRGGRR
jgi:hypothetical protein